MAVDSMVKKKKRKTTPEKKWVKYDVQKIYNSFIHYHIWNLTSLGLIGRRRTPGRIGTYITGATSLTA